MFQRRVKNLKIHRSQNTNNSKLLEISEIEEKNKKGNLKILYLIAGLLLTIFFVLLPLSSVKAYNGITAEQLRKEISSSSPTVLVIDVRTPEEYKGGHIPQSINFPLQILDEKISSRSMDKNTKIVVYCASGIRTHKAVDILEGMGFTNVYSLGGINNWPYEIEK